MKISEVLKNKRSFSVEVFPPKKEGSIEDLYSTIDKIKHLNPDFISVTYGAGGSTRENTERIARSIKEKFLIIPMAHLTCVGTSKEELEKIVDEFKNSDIKNVLALRGDIPRDNKYNNSYFKYAYQLVEFLKKRDFCIGVACYPEKHPEAKTLEEDIDYLRLKFDSGADFAITQLFFDNSIFYRFLDKTYKIIENKIIIPGIFIITNYVQLKKIAEIANPFIPKKLNEKLEKYKDSPEDIKKIGIEFAIEQSLDLLENGVKGIHFYIMNQKESILKIYPVIKDKF